ncbi:MAG: TrkH family potassium uptake protein [Cyanobacteria bacterium J06638_22]
MTVPRTICLGFLAVIAIGTLLLSLPFAIADGSWGNFVTSFFTATSAVCVTGLIVEDTGTYFSFFGQFLIVLLVQIGGLGYMTANTFLLLLLGRRLGLRDKLAVQQSLDKQGLSGAGQLVKSIIAVTLIFELMGAFMMIPLFARDFDLDEAIWLAVFHSVSAFNNAGFSLFPDSFIRYATSLPMNLILSLLIIVGGIGYQVIMETFFWLRDRFSGSTERDVFPLNFKVVVSTTIFLLIFGTIASFLVESHNEETLESFSLPARVLVAWFASVTARTAGFNTIDYGQMTSAGLFITIALMFIGASPGGTGSGVKTTTVRILYACTKAVLQNKEEVLCYQRRIPYSLVLKAVGVVFGSGATVIIVTTLISFTDPAIDFIDTLFESVSAFATVGLSTGITAVLSTPAKFVIILAMYIGRIGILVLMTAFLGTPTPSSVRYPEENLLVG